MEKSELNRRDFQRLSVAALGGLMAGTSLARADDDDEKPKKKDPKKPLLLQDPHVCRGLNASCKGEVGGEKNDCAGQSQCATAKDHSCGGENECAGLGGCGETPGENKCKGTGKCHVPLNDAAWAKARKSFEAAMKKAKKEFGAAPKKKKKK